MMENSFLDRLARALYLYNVSDGQLSEGKWENLSRSEHVHWQLLASAVFKGMREPTPFMREQGGPNSDVIWRKMVDAGASSGEYDQTDLDPTMPVSSSQIEDAYRRGYQQGASVVFTAVEQSLSDSNQKKLRDWIGVKLFKWRYDTKSKMKKQTPPVPSLSE